MSILLVVERVFGVVHVWVLDGLLEGLVVLFKGKTLSVKMRFRSILYVSHVLIEIQHLAFVFLHHFCKILI